VKERHIEATENS